MMNFLKEYFFMYVLSGCALLIGLYIKIKLKNSVTRKFQSLGTDSKPEKESDTPDALKDDKVVTVFHNGKKIAVDYASVKNKVIMEFNSEGVVIKVVDGLFYDEVPAVVRKEDFIKGDHYVTKDFKQETMYAEGKEEEPTDEDEDDEKYASIGDANILRYKE